MQMPSMPPRDGAMMAFGAMFGVLLTVIIYATAGA